HYFFFFSSRRRHTRSYGDWSSDVCSSDLYSVDVLSTPEPAKIEELDPKVYGVIVEDEGGARRGLLLPDLQGIETVSQQVEIAARSEERRVGKECREGGGRDGRKKREKRRT